MFVLLAKGPHFPGGASIVLFLHSGGATEKNLLLVRLLRSRPLPAIFALAVTSPLLASSDLCNVPRITLPAPNLASVMLGLATLWRLTLL